MTQQFSWTKQTSWSYLLGLWAKQEFVQLISKNKFLQRSLTVVSKSLCTGNLSMYFCLGFLKSFTMLLCKTNQAQRVKGSTSRLVAHNCLTQTNFQISSNASLYFSKIHLIKLTVISKHGVVMSLRKLRGLKS